MKVTTTFGAEGTTRVLLMGAGELGKEVAIAMARLGVEVHAADRYAGAPAHAVARPHVLDMTDGQAVRELVERVRPSLIVPEIEALATDTLVELEAEGVCDVAPCARATRLTMDREGIRRLAAEELGLPTSQYRFANSAEEIRAALEEIGTPAFVKPVMSSSGHGQSLVTSVEDAQAAWDGAVSGGRVGAARVIVERFVDFDFEITLLTVRALDPSTGEVRTRVCEPIGHRQSSGDYVESWQPQDMSALARRRASEVASTVVDALGGRGLFGVELFVCGDDVIFSEVSPRPHDTGLVTLCSQRLSEFELHARALLGLPVDVSLVAPAASAVVKAPADVEGPAGVCGVGEALAMPGVDVRVFGKPEAHAGRRMGVALARGESVEEARRRAQAAAAAMSVKAIG
ncbi:MAG: formate-dependent phosphoribosylglycinamide formyltransferase [Actinomycetaceae bacterium]|nr:formate-dependent phosphoribosylglycinamide formyltransferase [Actinomycetaceae bacterium]